MYHGYFVVKKMIWNRDIKIADLYTKFLNIYIWEKFNSSGETKANFCDLVCEEQSYFKRITFIKICFRINIKLYNDVYIT